MSKLEKLFDEFNAPTYVEWREATIKSLKGKSFEKLVKKTIEGVSVQPAFWKDAAFSSLPHQRSGGRSQPGTPPYTRGTVQSPNPWLIAQEINARSPIPFNKALLHDLMRGQTAVSITPDAPTLTTVADVATALDGVYLENIPIYVNLGTAVLPLASLFITHFQQKSPAIQKINGGLMANPIAALAQNGHLAHPITCYFDEIAKITEWTAVNMPHMATIAVQANLFHEAGGHAVQELALAMASGVAYIRAMQERGLDIDTIAPRIQFTFAIGAQFFMEVAKLRAARTLWASIIEAFGGNAESQKMSLHARTARRNKTATDPHVNMLRVTTEALSAAVGGATSLHIEPFDSVTQSGDNEFSRRIARNVQLILQEEANLTKLVDPAGGSFYVEYLTDQLAEKGWELFQEVEQTGGMVAALESGFVQEMVGETAVSRQQSLNKRQDILVGTNMYANLQENPLPPARVDYDSVKNNTPLPIGNDQLAMNVADLVDMAKAGATLNQISTALRVDYPIVQSSTFSPLDTARTAKSFETLRANADAFKAKYGHRPRIFMVHIGSPADHKPRADFAIGFFEVGGFEIIQSGGFDEVESALGWTFGQIGTKDGGETAVILCGSDNSYPDFVPSFAKKLKTTNLGNSLILAGYPKPHIDTFTMAGVDMFIYLGADCFNVNYDLQMQLLDKTL